MSSKSDTSLSVFRNASVSNTAIAVKAADLGRVWDIHAFNGNSVDVYLHFYDIAQASVSVGSTTPKISFWIPANGSIDRHQRYAWGFTTAITVACTTSLAGGSAPSSAIFVQLGYL